MLEVMAVLLLVCAVGVVLAVSSRTSGRGGSGGTRRARALVPVRVENDTPRRFRR
jgi:hypothetical protein